MELFSRNLTHLRHHGCEKVFRAKDINYISINNSPIKWKPPKLSTSQIELWYILLMEYFEAIII